MSRVVLCVALLGLCRCKSWVTKFEVKEEGYSERPALPTNDSIHIVYGAYGADQSTSSFFRAVAREQLSPQPAAGETAETVGPCTGKNNNDGGTCPADGEGNVRFPDLPEKPYLQVQEYLVDELGVPKIYMYNELRQLPVPKLNMSSVDDPDSIFIEIPFLHEVVQKYYIRVYRLEDEALMMQTETTREAPKMKLSGLETGYEYDVFVFAGRDIRRECSDEDGVLVYGFKAARVFIIPQRGLYLILIYAAGLLVVVPFRIFRELQLKKERDENPPAIMIFDPMSPHSDEYSGALSFVHEGHNVSNNPEISVFGGQAPANKNLLGAPERKRSSSVVLPVTRTSHPVLASEFSNYVTNNPVSIAKEFEHAVKISSRGSADFANKHPSENRYKDIVPFDSNRVVLQGNVYINASWVPGESNGKEFIATQGPKKKTTQQFWRMVLESECKLIVMLTSLVEKDKNGNDTVMCDQYWPDIGAPLELKGIVVTNRNEENYNSYIVRTFEVTAEGARKVEVTQFQFLIWPESFPSEGLDPTVYPLLSEFIEEVWQHRATIDDDSPQIVHCSSGCGRTGCYIIIHRVLESLFKNARTVDILLLLVEGRSHRMQMVQDSDQYMFVHFMVSFLIDRYSWDLMSDENEDDQSSFRFSRMLGMTPTSEQGSVGDDGRSRRSHRFKEREKGGGGGNEDAQSRENFTRDLLNAIRASSRNGDPGPSTARVSITVPNKHDVVPEEELDDPHYDIPGSGTPSPITIAIPPTPNLSEEML